MNKIAKRIICIAEDNSNRYAITYHIDTKEYNEIKELFSYCVDNNIICFFHSYMDGYILIFKDNSDFVQHFGSYSNSHCIEYYDGKNEPEIMTLNKAKKFVKEKSNEK